MFGTSDTMPVSHPVTIDNYPCLRLCISYFLVQNVYIRVSKLSFIFSHFALVCVSSALNYPAGDSRQRTRSSEGIQRGHAERREEDLPNQTDACWSGTSWEDQSEEITHWNEVRFMRHRTCRSIYTAPMRTQIFVIECFILIRMY